MNFEDAYRKFLNGSATPEEIEFVRAEMKRADGINEILNQVRHEGSTTKADESKVKAAIQKYNLKTTLKIVAIVCAALLVLMIAVACAIGIPLITSARANLNYTEEQAGQIAIEYLEQTFPDRAGTLSVFRVERDLEVMGRLKNAHYVYTVHLGNQFFHDIELEVDAESGTIIDLDWD